MPLITTLSLDGAAVALTPLEPVAQGDRRAAERVAAAALAEHLFNAGCVLSHTDQGAPRVDGRQVSISHSRTHAALAFHPAAAIGIDLESPRPQLQRVKSRFLSAEELDAFGSSDELLLKAWTAKEAVYKAAETLGPDLRDIRLAPDLRTARAAGREYTLHYHPLPPDLLCLAIRR